MHGSGSSSAAPNTKTGPPPLASINNDDEMVDFEDHNEKDDSVALVNSSYEEGDEKRVSSSSRVNFSKLTKKE